MEQDTQRAARTVLATSLVSCLISTGLLAAAPADSAGDLSKGTRSTIASAGGECPLPPCTIDFELPACPNDGEICGAIFAGGVGCVFDDLEFCYSSGFFSYRVDPDTPASITLLGDMVALDVFFANVVGSSGQMRFFNADKVEIGAPMDTNGECDEFMPKIQSRVFDEPVRFIEVSATGGQVYIDDFSVNPGVEPPLGDLTGDCTVGAADLLILLAAWGSCADPCPPFCPADLNEDCVVGAADLLLLLANWG